MAKIICWRGILLQAKTSQRVCPPVRLRCMRHHADAFRIKNLKQFVVIVVVLCEGVILLSSRN